MEQTKTCKKCGENKNLSEYPNGKNNARCKACVKIADKEKYLRHREKSLEQKRQKYAENKDAYSEKNKKYHEANKEKILLRKKDYYEKNKEQIIAKFRDNYKNDENFRLIHCIRRRTRDFIASGTKYRDLICCPIEYFRKWFEYNFELDEHLGMTWANFGEVWQIDHVFPLSKTKTLTEEHRRKYYTWKNLRPVPRSRNASKNGRVDESDLKEQDERVEMFLLIHPEENQKYTEEDNKEHDEIECEEDLLIVEEKNNTNQ